MSIEKLFKEKKEIQKQLDETSKRIYASRKKNMNGYQWDDRINCVDSLKKIDRTISNEFRNIQKTKKFY